MCFRKRIIKINYLNGRNESNTLTVAIKLVCIGLSKNLRGVLYSLHVENFLTRAQLDIAGTRSYFKVIMTSKAVLHLGVGGMPPLELR